MPSFFKPCFKLRKKGKTSKKQASQCLKPYCDLTNGGLVNDDAARIASGRSSIIELQNDTTVGSKRLEETQKESLAPQSKGTQQQLECKIATSNSSDKDISELIESSLEQSSQEVTDHDRLPFCNKYKVLCSSSDDLEAVSSSIKSAEVGVESDDGKPEAEQIPISEITLMVPALNGDIALLEINGSIESTVNKIMGGEINLVGPADIIVVAEQQRESTEDSSEKRATEVALETKELLLNCKNVLDVTGKIDAVSIRSIESKICELKTQSPTIIDVEQDRKPSNIANGKSAELDTLEKPVLYESNNSSSLKQVDRTNFEKIRNCPVFLDDSLANAVRRALMIQGALKQDDFTGSDLTPIGTHTTLNSNETSNPPYLESKEIDKLSEADSPLKDSFNVKSTKIWLWNRPESDSNESEWCGDCGPVANEKGIECRLSVMGPRNLPQTVYENTRPPINTSSSARACPSDGQKRQGGPNERLSRNLLLNSLSLHSSLDDQNTGLGKETDQHGHSTPSEDTTEGDKSHPSPEEGSSGNGFETNHITNANSGSRQKVAGFVLVYEDIKDFPANLVKETKTDHDTNKTIPFAGDFARNSDSINPGQISQAENVCPHEFNLKISIISDSLNLHRQVLDAQPNEETHLPKNDTDLQQILNSNRNPTKDPFESEVKIDHFSGYANQKDTLKADVVENSSIGDKNDRREIDFNAETVSKLCVEVLDSTEPRCNERNCGNKSLVINDLVKSKENDAKSDALKFEETETELVFIPSTETITKFELLEGNEAATESKNLQDNETRSESETTFESHETTTELECFKGDNIEVEDARSELESFQTEETVKEGMSLGNEKNLTHFRAVGNQEKIGDFKSLNTEDEIKDIQSVQYEGEGKHQDSVQIGEMVSRLYSPKVEDLEAFQAEENVEDFKSLKHGNQHPIQMEVTGKEIEPFIRQDVLSDSDFYNNVMDDTCGTEANFQQRCPVAVDVGNDYLESAARKLISQTMDQALSESQTQIKVKNAPERQENSESELNTCYNLPGLDVSTMNPRKQDRESHGVDCEERGLEVTPSVGCLLSDILATLDTVNQTRGTPTPYFLHRFSSTEDTNGTADVARISSPEAILNELPSLTSDDRIVKTEKTESSTQTEELWNTDDDLSNTSISSTDAGVSFVLSPKRNGYVKLGKDAIQGEVLSRSLSASPGFSIKFCRRDEGGKDPNQTSKGRINRSHSRGKHILQTNLRHNTRLSDIKTIEEERARALELFKIYKSEALKETKEKMRAMDIDPLDNYEFSLSSHGNTSKRSKTPARQEVSPRKNVKPQYQHLRRDQDLKI